MTGDIGIGTELAGYRIDAVIGRGGMGVVYAAEHVRLKRKAALKVLAPELSQDERFRERFVRESELAASLEHPNIVPIYDAGESGGVLYIAMRLVPGEDLGSLIERTGALEPERTAAIVEQVAAALDTAHAAGLVHRDVKPANILIATAPDGRDRAYLTDFGLTKRGDSLSGLTKTGQFLGSVDYAAPEQFEGKTLDARTDVYSLGCVAYRCLTGEPPFRRDDEAAVMYAHLQQPPPPVTRVKPDLPQQVDVVVAAAMAKDPAKRPATAGAFATALSAAIAPNAAPASVRTGRTRTLVLAGGAALIVGAVIAAAALLGRHPAISTQTPTPPPSTVPLFSGLVRIDPATGRSQGTVAVALLRSNTRYSKVIAQGDGVVWVLDSEGGHLFKVSSGGNVIATVDILHASALAAGNGAVWVGTVPILTQGGPLHRIDPTLNRIVRTLDVPGCCNSLAVSPGTVWAEAQTNVYRIDSRSGPVRTYDFGGQTMAIGEGRIWVLDTLRGSVRSIDVRTGTPGPPILLPGSPVGVAAGFGGVWVSTREGEVFRIPVSGGAGIDTISVGGVLSAISAGADAVWVVNPAGRVVVRIDPNTLKVSGRTPVDGSPSAVTATATTVWVAVEPQAPPTPNVGA